jgi:regulatory protein
VFEELDVDWIASVDAAWRKKFDSCAKDFREYAKQARFLQYRGFTADQISRVLTSDF